LSYLPAVPVGGYDKRLYVLLRKGGGSLATDLTPSNLDSRRAGLTAF
jgi:hypothetical protein